MYVRGMHTYATLATIVEDKTIAPIPDVQVSDVLRDFQEAGMSPYLVFRWVDDEELALTLTTKKPYFQQKQSGNDVLNVARDGGYVLYTWSTASLEGQRYGKAAHRPHMVVYIAGVFPDSSRKRNRHIYSNRTPDKSGSIIFKKMGNPTGIVPVVTVYRCATAKPKTLMECLNEIICYMSWSDHLIKSNEMK